MKQNGRKNVCVATVRLAFQETTLPLFVKKRLTFFKALQKMKQKRCTGIQKIPEKTLKPVLFHFVFLFSLYLPSKTLAS